MAKRLTVFYSWQSDTPSKLNRNFIEDALREALKRLHSDATLENALRDTAVELDKDTKGVAGSPPIVETILSKIDDCAVFIADVTFVGESKAGLIDAGDKPRQFPNPNVMLEYGFALKRHSHRAVIAVMNTAYGKPDAESLPFDLRHLRWPITYHLSDTTSDDKKDQLEKLVQTFVEAIGLVLSKGTSSPSSEEKFIPHKPTTTPAVYFNHPQELIPETLFGGAAEEFLVPNEGIAYLRLRPSAKVQPLASELEAKQLAETGDLLPFGFDVGGRSVVRNVYGALSYEPPVSSQLFHSTELFMSKEIWGIDTQCVNTRLCEVNFRGQKIKIIHVLPIEHRFEKALKNYLSFAKTALNLSGTICLEAGLIGIKGYRLSPDYGGPSGGILQDTIIWQGEELSIDMRASDMLRPFFELVWAKCGVHRPPPTTERS